MDQGTLLFVWAESVGGRPQQRRRRDAIYLGDLGGRPLVFYQTENPSFPDGYAVVVPGDLLFLDTAGDAAACATGRRALKVVINGLEGFLLPGTEKVVLRRWDRTWQAYQSLA